LLITAIQANDLPMVQTLTFIFAVLIVLFNLIADVLYGCSTRGSAMTETTPDRRPPRSGALRSGASSPAPVVGCLGPVQEAPGRAVRWHSCFLFDRAGLVICRPVDLWTTRNSCRRDATSSIARHAPDLCRLWDDRPRSAGRIRWAPTSWAATPGANDGRAGRCRSRWADGDAAVAPARHRCRRSGGLFQAARRPLMRLTDLFLALPLLPLLLVAWCCCSASRWRRPSGRGRGLHPDRFA
jgi:hypothetical protein